MIDVSQLSDSELLALRGKLKAAASKLRQEEGRLYAARKVNHRGGRPATCLCGDVANCLTCYRRLAQQRSRANRREREQSKFN